MTTICCVLRSGGDFDQAWVTALRRGVHKYLLAPHRFVCLADMDVEDAETVPLEHGWPGWWSKMNALDPSLWAEGERVILMDLDTLPVGNLYRLAMLDTEFAMLHALNPKHALRGKLVSGIVAFRAGESTEAARLYRLFASNPERWMGEYRGDGEFMAARVKQVDVIQEHVPGIVSLKWDAKRRPPEKSCLVLGHGVPRLSDPRAGWAHELWKERATVRREAA